MAPPDSEAVERPDGSHPVRGAPPLPPWKLPPLVIPEPLVVTALGLLGVLVGAAIIRAGVSPGPSEQFLRSQDGFMWYLLVCLMSAVCFIGTAPLGVVTRALVRHLRRLPTAVVRKVILRALVASALYVTLVALPLFVETLFRGFRIPRVPLNGWFPVRVGMLSGLGAFAATAGIVGVYLIDATARMELLAPDQQSVSPAAPSDEQQQVELYLWLRAGLQRILWILAVIIAVVVIMTGQLRHALATWYHEPAYPEQLLWIYGAYFTGLIALAYVPTYLALIQYGRWIRDRCCGLLPLRGDEGQRQEVQRRAFDTLLNLNTSVIDTTKTVLAVIAPLGGTLVTSLFGR